MIKLLISVICVSLVAGMYAQAPDYFHYQAMLRHSDGVPMTKEDVEIRVDLIRGSIESPSIYLEYHDVTTDDRGMVILKIGDGTFFNELDWEQGPYFISITVNGVHLGTSQLLSVPYALYARQAGNVRDDDPDPQNEIQSLSIDGDRLSLNPGNTVTLPAATTPWLENTYGVHYDGKVGIGVDARNPVVALDIQKNISGLQDRALVRLRNTDEGERGYVALALEAYKDKVAKTFFRSQLLLSSNYYDEIPDFRGMTSVMAPGSGFSVCTTSDYGSIRFYTSAVQDSIVERARFDPAGRLGIGTIEPEEKLQVTGGDIYVEEVGTGIILRSPDGEKWRVTVTNEGILVTESVTNK